MPITVVLLLVMEAMAAAAAVVTVVVEEVVLLSSLPVQFQVVAALLSLAFAKAVARRWRHEPALAAAPHNVAVEVVLVLQRRLCPGGALACIPLQPQCTVAIGVAVGMAVGMAVSALHQL